MRTVSKTEPEFLTVDEVAVLLRVNRKSVYRAIELRELPGVVKIGRVLRVRRSALVNDDG